MLSPNIRHLDLTKVQNEAHIPSWHGSLQVSQFPSFLAKTHAFKITDFFFETDACDFRIQSLIAKQLIAATENRRCKPCSSNAAFQLAICYSFGYGVRADPEKRLYWLIQSGKNIGDVEEAIKSMKHKNVDYAWMGTLIDLGYENDLGTTYRDQGILQQAVEEHHAMLSSREHIFGEAHFSTRRLRLIYAGLLYDNKQFEEAATITEKGLQLEKQIYGLDSRESPIIKRRLARTYQALGRFEESETLIQQALDSFSGDSQAVGAQRVSTLYDCASISLARGNNGEAIERGLIAVQESSQILGSKHRNTWMSKSVLATAYANIGELNHAIVLTEEVIDAREKAFGTEDLDTITALYNLGHLHFRNRNWQSGRDIYKRVLDIREGLLGGKAWETMHAASSYAITLTQLGEPEAATKIQEAALSELTETLGANHKHTVETMGHLAVTYQFQDLWHKSEVLERKVLDYRRRDPNDKGALLIALKSLSDSLYSQTKWNDVIPISHEEINLRQVMSNTLDKEQVECTRKYSRALVYLERWDEAALHLDQEIEWREHLANMEDADNNSENAVDRLVVTALAAKTYMKLQQLPIARMRLASFLELSLEIKSARPGLVNTVEDLATSCERIDWLLEEAEQLSVLELLLRKQLLPEQDGEARNTMVRLMELLKRQGKPVDYIEFNPTAIIRRALDESRRGG